MPSRLKDGSIDISKFAAGIERLHQSYNPSLEAIKKLFLEEQSFIVSNDFKKFGEIWNKYYNHNDQELALSEIKKAVFENYQFKKFKKNPEYSISIYLSLLPSMISKAYNDQNYKEVFSLLNSFAIYYLLDDFDTDRVEYVGTANSIYESVSSLSNYFEQQDYYDSNKILLHVFENILLKTISLQKLIQDNEKIVSWLFEKLYEIQEYRKYSGTEGNERLLEAKEVIVASFYSFIDPEAGQQSDIKDDFVIQNTTMRYLDIIFLIEHSVYHKDFHQLADCQLKAFYYLKDMLISSKKEQDEYELSQIHFHKVLDCLVDSYLKFPEFLEYNKSEAEKDSIMMFIDKDHYNNDDTDAYFLIKNLNFLCLKYLITDDKSAVVDDIVSIIERISKRKISAYDQLKLFESIGIIHKLVTVNEKLDSLIYSACNNFFDLDFQNAYNEAILYYKNYKLSKIIYGEETLDLTRLPQNNFVSKLYLVISLLDFIPDPGTDELRKKKYVFYSLLSSLISTDNVARKYVTIPLTWCLYTLRNSVDAQKKKQAIVFLTMFLLVADLEEYEIASIIVELKKEMQDNAVELLNVVINNLLFQKKYDKVSKDNNELQYKKSIMQGLDFKTKSLLKYMLQSEIETMNSSGESLMFNNVIRSWDILSFSGLTLATRVFFYRFFQTG